VVCFVFLTNVFLFRLSIFGLPRRSLLSARLPWFSLHSASCPIRAGERKSGLIYQTDGSGRSAQGICQTRDIRGGVTIRSGS